MKKRLLTILALASILAGSLVFPGFAAQQLSVQLDGEELKFDVPPQIINGRTMVPLAVTIEYLTGTTPGWIDPTKTVFFEFEGQNYRHNVGENILYINNQPTTFDTPSVIVDSRTLVPVRMLSDGLGLETNWDPNNYVVSIGSKPAPTPTPEPTPVPTPEPTPAPQPVSASIKTVTPGESRPNSQTLGRTATVIVTADLSVTRVKLVDDNDSSNEVIVRNFETVGDEHIFTIKWTPSPGGTGLRTPKIYAGTETDFGTEYVSAHVNIVTSDKGDVESATVNAENLYAATPVDITIITNPAVDRVWLNTPNEGDILETSTNYTNRNGSKEWKITWTPKNEGLFLCRAFGADANNYEDYSPLAMVVSSAQDKSAEYGKIYHVRANQSTVKVGDFLHFECVTSPDITSLGFTLSSGSSSSILRMVKDKVEVGQITWKASYQADEPGVFTCKALAKSSAGMDIEESIQVTVTKEGSGDSNNQEAAIKSMVADQTNVSLGSTVRVTIQTGPKAYAVMLDWNGQQEIPMSLTSGSDQAKIWSLDCQVSHASQQKVTFNARTIPETNSGAGSDTRTLTIEAY